MHFYIQNPLREVQNPLREVICNVLTLKLKLFKVKVCLANPSKLTNPKKTLANKHNTFFQHKEKFQTEWSCRET